MDYLLITLQVIVAVGIFNVWLLRFNRSTPYRGGDSGTMKQEFAAYGLPAWMVWLVGSLKVACALALLAGFMWPLVIAPAAALLALLMLGAIAMHARVRDPLKKSVPAMAMFLMNAVLVVVGRV